MNFLPHGCVSSAGLLGERDRNRRLRRYSEPVARFGILRIAATLVLLLATLGATHAQMPAGLEIPRPDLSAMEPAARLRIETMQNAIDGLLAEGNPENPALIESFGLLGQFFHAFELRDAAEVCYTSALALVPGDPRWSYLRALSRNTRGDLDGAVADYQVAVDAQPGALPFRLRLGAALIELGQHQQARRHFEKAIEIDPESAAGYHGLGQVAAAAGDDRAAATAYENALALQPEADAIYLPLAQAYRRLGDTERARQALEQRGERGAGFPDRLASSLTMIARSVALEVVADLAKKNDFVEADYLGFVLAQLGGTPGAADQMQQVLTSVESSGDASKAQLGRIHAAAASLLLAEKRDEEAILDMEKAVELDPALRETRLQLGNALARQQRFAEAVAQYDQILEARPDDVEVLLKRGAAEANRNELTSARASLERALQLAPADAPSRAEARRLLAGVMEAQGERAAAIELYRQVLESDAASDRVSAHLAIAQLQLRAGDFAAAGSEYQKVLEIDGRNVRALDGVGSLLAQLGHYQEAAAVFAELVALSPENGAARINEATALILAGEHVRARDRLEQAISALPDSLDVKDVLARHLAAAPDPDARNGQRAVELAEQVFARVPSAESVETLAMAYAQAGQFDKAIEWQQKLIAQAGEEAGEESVALWRKQLELYQRGEPCCP